MADRQELREAFERFGADLGEALGNLQARMNELGVGGSVDVKLRVELDKPKPVRPLPGWYRLGRGGETPDG